MCVCTVEREREKERQPATHIATLISFFFLSMCVLLQKYISCLFPRGEKKEGIPVSLVLICLLLFGKCV